MRAILFFIVLYGFVLRLHHEDIKKLNNKINVLEQKNKKTMEK